MLIKIEILRAVMPFFFVLGALIGAITGLLIAVIAFLRDRRGKT